MDETKYHGEPVAAVVAERKATAELAASKVVVQYEELPGVYTVADALDPDAPLVQEPALRPGTSSRRHNVLRERQFGWGDVDDATADLVIENVYTFPMITHFAIEPHAFIAAPDDGGVELWTATQNPFQMQRVIARRARTTDREGTRALTGPRRGVRRQAASQVRTAASRFLR